MKETCKKGFVEIPEVTLKALKGLLFTDKNGVDLSPIINDLSSENERDLTAINVALTFKGMKPEIDKTTRYSGEWHAMCEYEYISYSLILGTVTCKVTTYSLKGEKLEVGNTREESIDYNRWMELPTNRKEIENWVLEVARK